MLEGLGFKVLGFGIQGLRFQCRVLVLGCRV